MMEFHLPCLLLGLLVVSTRGAERVDVTSELRHTLERRAALHNFRFRRDAGGAGVRVDELAEVLALDGEAELAAVGVATTAQGTTLVKLQQTFQGDKVTDGVLTVETNTGTAEVESASGSIYRGLAPELSIDFGEELGGKEAATLCLKNHGDSRSRKAVSNVKVERQVLTGSDSAASRVFFVDYISQTKGQSMRRPACIVNAVSGQVERAWDAMTSASECGAARGAGGNTRTGKQRYGKPPRCLHVRREGGRCFLENKYVRVVHNNGTAVQGDPSSPTFSYDCGDPGDAVGATYSAALDAMYYGTAVGQMMEAWYGTTVLPTPGPMTLRVHYDMVDNGQWTGQECIFGDGGEIFLGMTDLDFVAHEMAHGMTEMNSGLIYDMEYGALNEAFSDITAMAATAFLEGKADWTIGEDTFLKGDAARYFRHPEDDGKSIGHADKFKFGINVHASSGVFNRAFYLLVEEQGMPIRQAYGLFVLAQQMYWHRMSSWKMAACDVLKAAYDQGQDGAKVRAAFRGVGVETDSCDVANHVVGLRVAHAHSGITVCRDVSPSFSFTMVSLVKTVTISVIKGWSPPVTITVTNKPWGVEGGDGDWTVYAQGESTVTFANPGPDSDAPWKADMTVTLSSNARVCSGGVTVMVTTSCDNVAKSVTDARDMFVYCPVEAAPPTTSTTTLSPEDAVKDAIKDLDDMFGW